MRAFNDIEKLISPKYPKLIEKVKQLIEDSEKRFSQGKDMEKDDFDSFLWEHSIHVAAIARKIALAEGVNATEAVISALFHDCGKFFEGFYHDNDIPEEEKAAELAQKILGEEAMDPAKIVRIVGAIEALYSETQTASKTTDVVHDADFLAKFGHLGIANFFVKSALRGQNLYNTLTLSLSKELTYASTLPSNMRTGAGKKLAESRSVATQDYYRGLLDELREGGIAFIQIIEKSFPHPKDPENILNLKMAVPETCPECSDDMSISFASETRIKCERLTAKIYCLSCSNQYQISFCLPEIAR